MAKQKLTETIDELIAETQAKPEPKPIVIETIYRSDADVPPQTEPEGERETVVRTRPQKPQTVTSERQLRAGDQTYTLKRKDPYGFWYIQADQGRTPDVLKGAYTSALEAEKELSKYVANR